MQTPKRLNVTTPEEVHRLIADHEARHYTKTEQGWICRNCGAVILTMETYLSLHTNLFSNCAGGGSVKKVAIPYCPNCELTPEERGCLHFEGLV